MALTDGENGMFTMPVAPMYGGGYGNNGFGFGGDWAWILLLLLLGGNGWGGFGGWGMGGFAADGMALYPWMNQAELTQSGFRDQMINSNIESIKSGLGDISTQICNGFSGAEIAANGRQMANMQSMFGIQSSLADCCCENRLGIADLKYTVATENCADRQVVSDGIRDILSATQAQTQAILTQLCNDKIEQKNDTIAQLRQELIFARGQASQDVQTAELRANNAVVANELLAEMRACPIPSQPVYGSQPIFTCSGNSGCGCTGM